MAGPHTKGERLRLRIRVFDGAGEPLPDALVELWQADAAGRYVEQPDHADVDPGHAFRGWGRLPTSAAGECTFDTIRPGATTAADGRQQAAHINVCLFFRGIMRHIFTRIYFADDPLPRRGSGDGAGARGAPPHARRHTGGRHVGVRHPPAGRARDGVLRFVELRVGLALMSSRLINSLATTDALATAFSDTAFLQGMLDFETALARAEASVGLVPRRGRIGHHACCGRRASSTSMRSSGARDRTPRLR